MENKGVNFGDRDCSSSSSTLFLSLIPSPLPSSNNPSNTDVCCCSPFSIDVPDLFFRKENKYTLYSFDLLLKPAN